MFQACLSCCLFLIDSGGVKGMKLLVTFTQCEEMKNLLSPKKWNCQINYLVICLVKMLLSRNFCQKSVRINFHYYHTESQSDCNEASLKLLGTILRLKNWLFSIFSTSNQIRYLIFKFHYFIFKVRASARPSSNCIFSFCTICQNRRLPQFVI